MQPITILHVTECYAGGVSRAIDTIVELIPEARHHLLWRGDEEPSAAVNFTSVTPLPKSMGTAIAAVASTAARLRPDVVHAHSSWAGVYTRVRPLTAPVLYEPHCYKFDDLAQPAVLRHAYRLAERALARRSALTIALSPHEEKLARSLRKSADVRVVPNSASLSPSAEYPATAYAGGRRVMMIGRLSPQKDPLFFASVAQSVLRNEPDVEFRWIGDGDPDMRRVLEESGVVVTGWMDRDSLAEELSIPSLYVHTARYEGFPLSILDAAAFEHPVIAREIPAFEGLGIPMGQTAEDLARLVVSALQGGPSLAAARDAAHALNRSMSSAVQRQALTDLYATFNGE